MKQKAPLELRRSLWLLVAACTLPGGAALAHGRDAPADRFVFSPYKDVTLALMPQTHELGTAVAGRPTALMTNGALALPSDVKTLTWAFAVGECGEESWMGVDAQKFAQANVAAFNAAGIDYIVSTGGAKGVFTCDSDAGMERFIARYSSPQLIGIDFDIEAGQTPEHIDSLVQRIKAASVKHPQLRFSFTLATLAASDGSRASLNAQGERVLAAARRYGLANYYLNLMVMDYGPAQPANCGVVRGRCDMAASAVQAARNVHRKYGVPFSRIELTPMIGVNDVVENVFTLADAKALAAYARRQRLGGLHFWSLDRDTPCKAGEAGVAPTCHTLDGLEPLAYTRTLAGKGKQAPSPHATHRAQQTPQIRLRRSAGVPP